MADIKHFEIASAQVEESDLDDDLIEFDLPAFYRKGEEPEGPIEREKFISYRPTAEQIAILSMSWGATATFTDRLAAAMSFIAGSFETDSQRRLINRLQDRLDPLSLKEVNDILDWLLEQWTGNPTDAPAVSTSSPHSTGRRSTAGARPKGPIRSGSARIASAT